MNEIVDLCIDQLAYSRNNVEVFRPVSFVLHAGQAIGIIGPNGSGKTTFLDCLFGILHQTGGKVTHVDRGLSREITHWSTSRRASIGIRRHFQKSPLLPRRSARELIMAAGSVHLVGSGGLRVTTAKSPLAELVSSFDETADCMSFGQARALLLCLVLGSAGRVLLLDEPFEGMSAEFKDVARSSISMELAAGCIAVLVDHDRAALEKICDSIVEFPGALWTKL